MARIRAIDRWLETMRTARGYGGPVVHWWESCFGYTGAMADWRYEGIICGYLNLAKRLDDNQWLSKAERAANDLIRMQLPDGRFDRSSFQRGPIPGGTPHEAAVDVALLELALNLKEARHDSWRMYSEAARRNLEDYHIARLLTPHGFIDQPGTSLVVSNKNATILESLLLAEEVCGSDYGKYVNPAIDAVLRAQSTRPESLGGDRHFGTPPHILATGIYTARSANAIARLYRRQNDERLREYLDLAVSFLRRLVSKRGTMFGFTEKGTRISCPEMIAGSGDVLRTFITYEELTKRSVPERDVLLKSIMDSQKPNGSFPTARGFARLGREVEWDGYDDLRDTLPVAGWIDKVFRALTMLDVSDKGDFDYRESVEDVCHWFGRKCVLSESGGFLKLERRNGTCLYSWRKGEPAPRMNSLSPI